MNSEKRRVKFGKQKREALLFAILFATLALSVTVGCASAKTITVDDDPGMADYEHIQDAVNVSVPGDIIYVYEGLYIEHVEIDNWDSIQLIGDDRENVIIDGGWSETCITIKKDNTTITNFTMQNSGSDNYGISIEYADDCLIATNTINSNGYGIGLYGSSGDYCKNNRITNNEITSNSGNGICLGKCCDYNKISGNEIRDNDNHGLYFYEDNDYNEITHNDIISNDGSGIHLYHVFV